MPTLLILTPQLVELESLRAGFEQCGYELVHSTAGRLDVWSVRPLDFVLATAGHGKAQFALQAQYLLDRQTEVERVVCTGGAGGLDPQLKAGDIVVGTVSVEHDYHIRFVPSPPPEHPAHAPFLSALWSTAEAGEFGGRIWFNRIASGDEDVVDPVRAAQLREEADAVCVAWEGSGAARVAAFNGVPFVEIRGITDTANKTARNDYHRNLQIVMPRIAELLVRWRQQNEQ